jgi:hypothetical protein
VNKTAKLRIAPPSRRRWRIVRGVIRYALATMFGLGLAIYLVLMLAMSGLNDPLPVDWDTRVQRGNIRQIELQLQRTPMCGICEGKGHQRIDVRKDCQVCEGTGVARPMIYR